MNFMKWMIQLALMIATVYVSHDAAGQTSPPTQDVCDPGLTGSPNSALGYSMRGNRCEGLYALQVNSTDVRLASLVETFELDSDNSAPLTVHWPTVADSGPVRLRAQSLRPRSYYRMDTTADPTASGYSWPTEILGTIGLARDEVGVLGWFERESASEGREVYLPLRIAQGADAADGTSYEIVLIPDIRLREVKVTLKPVDPHGSEGRPLIDKKPLELGYYPAKQATVFYLPKPETPGFYKLQLACDLMPSGLATTTFWFYHAG